MFTTRPAVDLPAIALLVALCGLPLPSQAGIAKIDLATVGAAPQPGARLPLQLNLTGETGEAKPLRQWLSGTPSVWVLADFTCQTLCGPVIGIVANALENTSLRPGTDFRLVVAGLDPRDSAENATAMKNAQVGSGGSLSANTYFLRGSAATVAGLSEAFGFHAIYDSQHDQYAHPAAAFVVTPDGHIARALPGLALDPANLRLALVEASQGRVGTWTDHIKLLCYGFDPASGVYTAAVGRLLAATGGLTIIGLVALVTVLLRRERAAMPRG